MIGSDWPRMRLKHVVTAPVRRGPDIIRPFVTLEDVQSGTGALLHGIEERTVRDGVLLEPGDVAFNKLRPYLRKSLLVDRPYGATGELVVLRPSVAMDQRYLLYLTLSDPWLSWADVTSEGTKMPRTSAEALLDLAMMIPPIGEQRRIADFLDAEVNRLRRTRYVRSAQVELQLERWRSQVSEAVFVREGRTVALKRLFSDMFAGLWGGEPGTDDVDISCVRVADFDREQYRASSAPTVRSVSEKDLHKKALRAGDVLLEKSGGTGAKPVGCASIFEGIPGAVCSNFIQVLRPSIEYEARYIGYVMAALYETRRNGAFVNQTTGIQNLDLGAYLSSTVAVPPRDEQRAIVARLDDARRDVVALRAVLQRSQQLLEERQDALITAAVTGQIDVTTARGVA